ncbi:hypothetical protein [Pontibacter pamirensis]|uniref:hypothetical protein n=1 Tax=Pontibacter pamirensis TaxID=2562824 RepID=UPI0013893F2C|nr:hypothetical protein [Pontibacter pamirensis]
MKTLPSSRLSGLTAALSLLLLFSSACDKEKDAEPAPQPEAKENSFNFRFDPHPEGTEEFELIVSQKDGKVLIDTLIAARVHHELKVKSNDTKLNITTMYVEPIRQRTEIRTYVQVNPDNWHIDERVEESAKNEPEQSYVNYSNVPPYTNTEIIFSGKQTGGWGAEYNGNSRILRVQYNRRFPTDLTYLLLPELGKYIYAEVTSPETDIDFSGAATAAKHVYNKPAGVKNAYSEVYGYTNAGEYSKWTMLYYGNGAHDYDLLFPPVGMEEFQTTYRYTDAEGYSHLYRNFGTSIPADMGFLAESGFTVTRNEFGNFQIMFGEDKPSAYKILGYSQSLNTVWHIMLSPEETAFKAKSFLEGLGAETLKGKDLSTFSLVQLSTLNAKGYTHQTMHDYLNNPEAYRKRELKQYREISKYF